MKAEKNGWYYPRETHRSGGKNMKTRNLHFILEGSMRSVCGAWHYWGEEYREVIYKSDELEGFGAMRPYPCKKCAKVANRLVATATEKG